MCLTEYYNVLIEVPSWFSCAGEAMWFCRNSMYGMSMYMPTLSM